MRQTSAFALAASVAMFGCASPQQAVVTSGIPAAQGDAINHAGIRYIDVAIGTGVAMSPRQCVYTHYTGWLADGTKFDSSRDTTPNGAAGEPISFRQGAHRVLEGWDVGFDGMRVGGKRRLFVPHQLAYGEQGAPPVIPPRAALVFDVELMAVAEPARSGQCPAWRTLAGS